MSDTPEYILKRPVTIKRFPTEEGSIGRNKGYEEVVTVRRPDGERLTDVYPDEFEELFVPLDRQATQAKIIDLTQQYYGRDEAYDNEQKEFANEIMRLFGLSVEEQK